MKAGDRKADNGLLILRGKDYPEGIDISVEVPDALNAEWLDLPEGHSAKLIPWIVKDYVNQIERGIRKPSDCKYCDAKLVWMFTSTGRKMPLDIATGLPHRANCPGAAKARRQR